jgi:hypothetical protein
VVDDKDNTEIYLKAHEAWDANNLLLAFQLFLNGAQQGSDSCMLGYPKHRKIYMNLYLPRQLDFQRRQSLAAFLGGLGGVSRAAAADAAEAP